MFEQDDYQRNDKPAQKRELKKLIESDNIAEDLEDEELRVIADRVLDEYMMDEGDADRQEKVLKWRLGKAMATQKIEHKETPWSHASSVKYPLITNASIQFSARAYPAIITPSGVVKKKIIGKEKKQQEAQAQQLQQAMQGQGQAPQQQMQQGQNPLQMQGQMPVGAGLKPAPTPTKNQIADNAVAYMNYQYTCEMTEWIPDTDRLLLQLPLYGSMYRKKWYSKLKGRPCSTILTPLLLVLPKNISNLEESPRITELQTFTTNEIQARIRSGIFRDFEYKTYVDSEDTEDPEEFIEQHRYLDLDGDGYKEPYIVTVHVGSQSVCRIVANYTLADIELGNKKRIANIKKQEFYIEYVFIPGLDGTSYATGFYDLLVPINDSVNTTINQLIDAGTLANSNSGFIGKDLKMNRGPMRLEMGRYTAVNARGDDIRKGLVPMQFPGPNPVLFQLMEFLLTSARELSNTQNIMENAQRANMPATTTLALIEQGSKVSNAIYKRIHRSLSKEFKLLKKLNAQYLNPNQYEQIIDARVSPDDFKDESFDFEPVSDPEEVSDIQRMAKAQFLLSLLGNPVLNPVEVTRRILESSGIDDVDALITAPQPAPPDPKIQVEMQKLELEKIKFQLEIEKLRMESRESEARTLKQKTSAIKDIADAEAVEAGQQLQQYTTQLDLINGEKERQEEAQRQNTEQANQAQDRQTEADRYGQEQQLAQRQQGLSERQQLIDADHRQQELDLAAEAAKAPADNAAAT